MKLTKIGVKDFRGFSHEEAFDLGNGKNLLLYGENGSGKSSLYRALVEFFNRDPKARSFGWYRNVFSSGGTISSLDGHVTLEFSDGARREWKCLGKRPHSDPALPQADREHLVDAASRAAMLDYRSLLRTNFVDANVEERLFALSVISLLANAPVPVAGGKQRTIGQLWQSLRNSKPVRHTKGNLARVAAAEKTFNGSFGGILPDVEKKVTEFLAYFTDSNLELQIGFPGVHYDENRRAFTQVKLSFQVKLRGVVVPEWNDLLNEARLSALAISLYLAGTALANTTPPPIAGTPVRLLVLDDILIGLDLTHRLPILRILEEKFADFQILLFTYDRVWFDMAQMALTNPDAWVCYEMHSKQVSKDGTVFDAPTVRSTGMSSEHFISVAKQHLGTPNHDTRAAALYARAALEVKLKSYCSKQKVQVPYDIDGRHLNTDHFLNAVERRLVWSGTKPSALFKLQRVNLFRNGVLNPFAHFHPVTLARSEVEAALHAVDSLTLSNDGAVDFAKKADDLLHKAAPTPAELIDAACYLRTAFEVDLRGLLIRHGGVVRFRDDWTKIELDELWNAAKTAMATVNAAIAGPLILSIEAHPVVFLNEWTYAAAAALTKVQLDAAWNDLRIPAPAPPRTQLATFA